ncbi:hypothetical protein KEM48_009492 [Puccinia striiformis f. sp. tritici PST-130]|nr:hypothetical protein KEM48_009492 [Puccinia striiformis f. sp. tritici PST-130]
MSSSHHPHYPHRNNSSSNNSNARLPELIESLKQEFENISNESQSLRTQTQEFESHINLATNDLSHLREQLFHLDREHQKVKTHYEEELRRLHQELEQRNSNNGPFNYAGERQGFQIDNEHPAKRIRTENQSHQENTPTQPPPPTSTTTNTIPASSSPVTTHPPPSARILLPEPKTTKIKNDPQQHPKSAYNNTAYHGPPNPTGPTQQQQQQTGVGGNTATTTTTTPAPPPPAAASNPNPPSSTTTTTQPQNIVNHNHNVLLDLDPDSLPSSMKKEGVDWLTMFNPKVKKVLDVGLVHTLVHESVVCCVKFSPDGTILATGCNRYTSLYDTRTGSKICQLLDEAHSPPGPDNYIRSASFSPDGKLLATGSEDRIIRIWEVSQQRIINRFQGHKSEIYSLAFSPDGRILVSGSGDKTARIWEMSTGKCIYHLMIEEKPTGDSSTTSAAATTTAAGESTAPVDAGVTSVCVSPDGTLLAAGSLDTVVRLWDIHNGLLLDKLKGHSDSVYSVAFSPDGKFLVSGSLDRTLKLWDLSTLNRDGNPPFNHHHNQAGKGEDIHPAERAERGENGEKITSDRGFDSSRSTTLCTTTLSGHKDYVLSVAVSPDGEWIMSGSKDRGVQFWDPKSGMAQFMLQGHKNSVISIAVSDTGGLLATGSGDWHARIWSYDRMVKK